MRLCRASTSCQRVATRVLEVISTFLVRFERLQLFLCQIVSVGISAVTRKTIEWPHDRSEHFDKPLVYFSGSQE